MALVRSPGEVLQHTLRHHPAYSDSGATAEEDFDAANACIAALMDEGYTITRPGETIEVPADRVKLRQVFGPEDEMGFHSPLEREYYEVTL